MLDHIPMEIQVEIMKRLPIKSLIRFRCVSKTCKSLIESSHFIIAHYYSSLPHTQPLHLFASHDKLEQDCFSVVPVDDDPFPPVLFDIIYYYPEIIGCSHGLFCLYGIYKHPRDGPDTWMAVIWNLSIKKAFAVVMPDVVYDWHEHCVGFGVSRETADLKIVRITPVRLPTDLPEVEVFTLSTGAWRSSYGKLPRKSIEFYRSQVVVDGFLYWLAYDDLIDSKWYVLIISFDLTTEEFREVNLPDCLASMHGLSLIVSKLRESLVVIEKDIKASNIWMMDDGGFTKLYTVNTRVRGIMNSGESIIQVYGPRQGHRYYYSVAVYEPYSELIKNLGISGSSLLFLYPYMETLLLLDQPDFIIYDQGRRYVPNEGAKILKEQNACKAYQQGSRKTLKLWMFSKENIIKVYRRG